jgi:hypothetical protein
VQLRQCPLLPIADLMMVYGGGVDPQTLKFDCSRCKPQIKITLLEVHPEYQTPDDPQTDESRRQDHLVHRALQGMTKTLADTLAARETVYVNCGHAVCCKSTKLTSRR